MTRDGVDTDDEPEDREVKRRILGLLTGLMGSMTAGWVLDCSVVISSSWFTSIDIVDFWFGRDVVQVDKGAYKPTRT